MQKIQCEMCGGVDVVKDGDFYVCQNCGTKYTPESARKLLVQIDYETGRDKDLKELRALRDKLAKEASLEKTKRDTQARIDKMQGQLETVQFQKAPTDQALDYRGSLLLRIEDSYMRKVKIFNVLFKKRLYGSDNNRQLFYDNLPPTFNRQDYINVAQRFGIPQKTAEKYIALFCKQGSLKHPAQGKYEKAQ